MKKLSQLAFLTATSLFVSTTCFLSSSPKAVAQTLLQAESQTSIVVAQAQSEAIASGNFVAGEAPTTGSARIVTEGGHRYLELDGAFSTSDQGPDLHVLLDTTDQPPQTYQSMGSFINLGALHSPSGTQRYPIPDSIRISRFHSVVIWCRMANATFGYAPLE